MDESNIEIVDRLNKILPGLLDRYFDNINSMVFKAEKTGILFKVPTKWVEVVEFNYLPFDDDTPVPIKHSEVTETLRNMYPARPVVRVAITIETILESANNSSEFSALLNGIVNSVQKQWELKYGSYTLSRWGSVFFQYKPLVYEDRSDYVFFDFYGDFASNEVAR